jgi:hypothetical protein
MSQSITDFQGGIIGMSGKYQGYGYPLRRKEQVFFQAYEKQVEISKVESKNSVGSVFYVQEYDEYCFEPFYSLTCFLASGQPLGKERCYYLPRGSEIYIFDKNNHFKLA